MTPLFLTYCIYVALSIGLTVWVAHTLFKHGRSFLVQMFRGDEKLADSVNHLLVVGFYLINFGYDSYALRTTDTVIDPTTATEVLSTKIGVVLLVLGILHFSNLLLLNTMRRGSAPQAPFRGQPPPQPLPGNWQPVPGFPQAPPPPPPAPAAG